MNTISRYMVASFLKTFAMVMSAVTGLFLILDFFQRIGQLTAYEAEASAIMAYFLLKLPGIVGEIYPAVTLLSVLISIGLLARHREILAMRACGLSTWQLAAHRGEPHAAGAGRGRGRNELPGAVVERGRGSRGKRTLALYQ